MVGALGQDDVLAAVSGRGEEHEDGRLPPAPSGGWNRAKYSGSGYSRALCSRAIHSGARCGHAVSTGPADGASSNFSSLAALSGSVSPMP